MGSGEDWTWEVVPEERSYGDEKAWVWDSSSSCCSFRSGVVCQGRSYGNISLSEAQVLRLLRKISMEVVIERACEETAPDSQSCTCFIYGRYRYCQSYDRFYWEMSKVSRFESEWSDWTLRGAVQLAISTGLARITVSIFLVSGHLKYLSKFDHSGIIRNFGSRPCDIVGPFVSFQVVKAPWLGNLKMLWNEAYS